ncbi:MAG: DUF4190 domain-containing protein [Verrucomicrobiota bacterium]
MYRILGVDGREYGPVSAEQLRRWVAEGRADAETKTRTDAGGEWKPLALFPEFSPLFPPQFAGSSPLPGRRTNSFAVTGLIFGILSVTGGLCCYGLPFNLLGLIFSLIGLAQINGAPQTYTGKGMAVAGVVLSVLGLLLMLGLITFVLLSSHWNWSGRHFHRL